MVVKIYKDLSHIFFYSTVLCSVLNVYISGFYRQNFYLLEQIILYTVK